MTPLPISTTARMERVQSLAGRLGFLAGELSPPLAQDGRLIIPDLGGLRDIVQLWAELLSNTHVQEDCSAQQVDRPGHWLSEDTLAYVSSTATAIEQLVARAKQSPLPSNPGEGDAKIPAEAVRGLRSVLRASLTQAKNPLKSHLTGDDYTSLARHVEYVLSAMEDREFQRLTRLADRALAAATETEAAKDVATAAAGQTGDLVMASFYQNMATKESAAANTFRKLTVIISFVAAVGAGLFIVGPAAGLATLDIPAGDYVHLVQRGIFLAGVLGLAGYFARQAHQHRSMANWSGALAVQLQTFEAYLSPIDDSSVKNELRQSFATRVFGDHPAMKGEPSVAPSAAAMDTAVGWVAKLTGRGPGTP